MQEVSREAVLRSTLQYHLSCVLGVYSTGLGVDVVNKEVILTEAWLLTFTSQACYTDHGGNMFVTPCTDLGQLRTQTARSQNVKVQPVIVSKAIYHTLLKL